MSRLTDYVDENDNFIMYVVLEKNIANGQRSNIFIENEFTILSRSPFRCHSQRLFGKYFIGDSLARSPKLRVKLFIRKLY